MNVIFFKVEGVLNFEGSDAKAPDGEMGIAEARVKELRGIADRQGARIVLTGDWRKDWDFDDSKCTKNGIYLNKKLERKGLHILDKTKETENDIDDWLKRHKNVEKYCVLDNIEEVKWLNNV